MRKAVVVPYATALAIFLSSRFVIYLAIVFAALYVRRSDAPDLWDAGGDWYHYLLRWDAGWYAMIVDQGYHGAAKTAAFYPFYPLVAKALTGLGIATFPALLIVASGAAIVAALLLFKLARERFDDETAYLSVAALGLFPPSLFLSAAYSESLALVFILAFFLAVEKRHLLVASLFAGLALATRSTGIVLVPVLLWETCKAYRGQPARLVLNSITFTILATSGLILFMAYLGFAFGDPLKFATVQSYWHGGGTFGERLIIALTLTPLLTMSEGLVYFIACLTVLILFWRRIGVSQTIYGVGVLMLPYLTLAGGPAAFGSMPRFALLAFPVFLIIAQLCRDRLWLSIVLTSLGTAGLFAYTAAFAQWHWAG